MSKVSGISFENVENFRETVQVPLPDGTLYDLPLITARDASMAQTFLNRHSVLCTQHAILQTRLTQRATACAELQKQMEENPDKLDEFTGKEALDAVEKAMKAIEETNIKMGELVAKSKELTDEIHEFIAPYVKSTPIIELLKKCADGVTIEVLRLMLWGAAALKDDKEEEITEEKENPTQMPSQTS